MQHRSNKKMSSVGRVEGNDDLLIEILLFLPAKSLVRLKLVSKRWCVLISAPSFCRLHALSRKQPQTQPLLILGLDNINDDDWIKYLVYNIHSVPRRRSFSLPFPLIPCGISQVRILQSCNGLILVRCRKQEDTFCCYVYYVFNPTTMQLRDLSPLPFIHLAVAGIYLMFDPSLSPLYRVVSFVSLKPEHPLTLIYVYHSHTHQWNLAGQHNRKAINFCNGIHFNGAIYFVGRFFSRCFQPDTNIVRQIPNPPRLDDIGFQRDYAVESNGILLSLTLYEKQDLLVVSEMNKDVEERWTIKYEVDMNPILATCSRSGVSCLAIRLLCMLRGEKEKEKEEESLLMLTFDNKVMIYSFHDNGFEVLLVLDDVKERCRDAHLFIQSLAPV